MILTYNRTSWLILEFTDVEHVLEDDSNIAGAIYTVITSLMILIVNCSLISFVLPSIKKTIINKFIFLDCVLCIGNIVTIINIEVLGDHNFAEVCQVAITFNYTWNILNASLSIVIIFYRSIMVFKSQWIETKSQKLLIRNIVLVVVAGMTGFLAYLFWQNTNTNIYFLSKCCGCMQ